MTRLEFIITFAVGLVLGFFIVQFASAQVLCPVPSVPAVPGFKEPLEKHRCIGEAGKADRTKTIRKRQVRTLARDVSR